MSYSLVGIDVETGGLDGYVEVDNNRVHGAAYYPILEIGVLVATPDLEVKDKFSVGINPSAEALEKMHPWAQEQHQKSGLLDALKNGDQHDFIAVDLKEATSYIVARLEKAGAHRYNRKERTGSVVFGNTVGFDMNFIGAQMPELADYFHYRKIDISVIDMLARTAWKDADFHAPKKQYGHTALADIEESFVELSSYTKTIKRLVKNASLMGTKF
jgi:oligoribonuclease